ncbi:hypothetical protein IWQ62_000147 [Dispira parvispora]|uniref:Uncharacterized protein n=1 Tax=Dispira parvispora TaxID=1520584 RepID=A0A9W8AVB3_9FUNG|nr:hypothetical protein IWQ62_000147 [Dispira parvispora]
MYTKTAIVLALLALTQVSNAVDIGAEINDAINVVTSGGDDLINGAKEIATNVASGAVAAASNAGNKVDSAVDGAASAFSSASQGAHDKVVSGVVSAAAKATSSPSADDDDDDNAAMSLESPRALVAAVAGSAFLLSSQLW